MPESLRQRKQSLINQLRVERETFTAHWRDLSNYILPRRMRQFNQDRNRGGKRNSSIIDSTGTLAARTMQSGMVGGLTSPARPWYRLTMADPELAEFGPVKEWLEFVVNRMRWIHGKSNLYTTLATLYGDLGVFATGAMSLMEDQQDVIRCYQQPIGSYMIGVDERLKVNTFARELSMTVRQVVERFGDKDAADDKGRFLNISPTVRKLWEKGQYESWVEIVHVVSPNDLYDSEKLRARYKLFASCYWEVGSDQETFLEQTGFDEFPYMVPRWEVTGEDIYGTRCPGMDALGDIQQLQFGEKKATRALEKIIDPPLVSPTSMKNQTPNLLPGGVNYVDLREGMQGMRPVHEVRATMQDIEFKQDQLRQRIRRAFFEDLFLMLSFDQRQQPRTATEIAQRYEEKMIVLTPVLERLDDELLDPIIDRTFGIMLRRGLLPPPPLELQGRELSVEYISIMAQAQKMIATAAVEKFVGFVGGIASAKPEVLDKLDADQTIDEYGEMVGVPPSIIHDDDEVERIRQNRAAAQQQAATMSAMEQAAKSGKILSETNTEGDNALTRLLGVPAA